MKRVLALLLSLAACSSETGAYPLNAATGAQAQDAPQPWLNYCNWMQACAPAPFSRSFATNGACAVQESTAGLDADCVTALAATPCPPEENGLPRACRPASEDAGLTDAKHE